MAENRMDKMLELLKQHKSDEDLTRTIAELRDSFLCHDMVSEKNNYDIANETVCGPEYVLYYIAEYIAMLEAEKGIKTELNNSAIKIIEEKEQENERLREAIEIAVDALEEIEGFSVKTFDPDIARRALGAIT